MKQCILWLASLLFLAGCGGDIEPGQTEAETLIIKGLGLAPVEAASAVSRRVLDGTVEAFDQSQIMARLSGRVGQVLVREGDTVQAGAELIVLDEQTATDQLETAQAAVLAAEARLAEAQAQQRLTLTTLQRYQQLRAGEAVTPQELDQVTASAEAARQKVLTAEAGLTGARANLGSARTLAGQARITAPYTARINQVLVDIGSTVMPGTPLLEIDRVGPWRVRIEVPESLVESFQIGSLFAVTIPAQKITVEAKVSEVSAAASPLTRTVTIKLDLLENAALKSGQFAKVAIPSSGATRLLVPSSAIVTRGQLTAVYVARDGTLHYRLVCLGATTDSQTEILAGLKPGEIIVTTDVNRARHGARVEE